MGTIYFADFLDKKLLRKEVIGDEDTEESLPDLPDQVKLDKLSYFSELVGSGTVSLKIDATKQGIDVPENFKVKQLTVTFSHTFKPEDLKYDELGLSQTLSFKGFKHKVKVPWDAVTYIGLSHGGKARTWTDGKPPSIITFPNIGLKQPKVDPEPPKRA